MSQSSANYNILSNTVDIGGASVSAFGTVETGELTPLVQLDFVYGINTQTGVTSVSGAGATVDTNGSRLRVQSGTATNGTATFTSRNTAKYRPGQGITARFTCAFAAGAANNIQIVGSGTSSDGYFFGYNGTSFGILLKTGGSSTWIAQSSWNGDKCDGSGSGFTWNPQYGNVMMIKYPYLGFGAIKFYVSSPLGVWILCHTIQYPNTTTAVQVSNPNLNFYIQNVNSGNTTNLTMYVGSVGFFLSGKRSFTGSPKWTIDNFKSSITTETCLINLKNCTTYNSVTNRSLMRLNFISFSGTSVHTTVLRLKLGATIGGSPSYTPISGSTADNGVTITSGHSIASYDTAGTTVANGTYIFGISLIGGSGNAVIDLTPYDLYLAPTEILTVSGFCTNASEIATSIGWSEDI